MAITWLQKDPDEVDNRAHDFSGMLDEGETVLASDYVITRVAGTVVIDSKAVGPTSTTVMLSGGSNGETSVFEVVITTSEGRTLNETIILPIVSTSVTDLALTGYAVPSAANFIARFPRFAAVAPSVIAAALVEAAGKVDTTWAQADFAMGRMLWAAHVLTLDGLGTGAEAQGNAQGAADFKVMRSGALTLERFDRAGGSTTSAAATSYGKRWLELARANRGGPLTAPAIACGPSGIDPWVY